jgi:hypothetical protein
VKIEYKTEEELDSGGFKGAEGEADFVISSAQESISKSGNEMIKIGVKVWDKNGEEGVVLDYLVGTVAFKIKQICESIGKPEWYSAELDLTPEMLEGMGGKCILKIEKSTNPEYSDSTKIKSYIAHSGEPVPERAVVSKKEAAVSDISFDDDMPF